MQRGKEGHPCNDGVVVFFGGCLIGNMYGEVLKHLLRLAEYVFQRKQCEYVFC